jgi:uncharacterized protein YdeI (YjbR/CyaY-like superfamily)
MEKRNSNIKSFTPKNKEEWRKWLEKNHEKESKVALIKYKKHTGKPILSSKEAMEEAICFGWIDTTIKRLDEDRYIQHFSKRNKNSKWSYNTLNYAKRLIKEEKMSPFGLKMYKEGLAKLPHDHGIPKDPEVPEDLKTLLNQNKKAKENFDKLSSSARRTYLRWLLRAKMSETKNKRMKLIIDNLEKGKKLF